MEDEKILSPNRGLAFERRDFEDRLLNARLWLRVSIDRLSFIAPVREIHVEKARAVRDLAQELLDRVEAERDETVGDGDVEGGE